MINQKEFELHQHIVDWLMEHGSPFMEAMAIVSYAYQADKSVPEAYFEVKQEGWLSKDGQDERIVNDEKEEINRRRDQCLP